MSIAFGNKAFIGFAEESTFGTYVAATKFLEIMEESFAGDRPFIAKPSLRNVSQIQKVYGKVSVKGGFKAQMGFAGFERIFKHALGSSGTTGAGPYAHTATLSNDLPTGLSFIVDRDSTGNGGDASRYFGCNIDKLTIRQAIEEMAEIEVSVIGQNWTSGATPETPTFPTLDQADWYNFTSISFDGQTVPCKEMEFTLENDLATDRYRLGSFNVFGFGRKGPRKLSGKFSFERDSSVATTLIDDYIAQNTPFTITHTWSNQLSGADLRSITVNAKGLMTKVEENAKDAGPIMLNVEWDGYATTSNNELTIVTINGSSTI